MAEPTRPRWPATKIFADLLEKKESVERKKKVKLKLRIVLDLKERGNYRFLPLMEFEK